MNISYTDIFRDRSERDFIRINAKSINPISRRERYHGAATYQIATPLKDIIYVLESLPVLNKTSKSSTEANMQVGNPDSYTGLTVNMAD